MFSFNTKTMIGNNDGLKAQAQDQVQVHSIPVQQPANFSWAQNHFKQ